MSVKVVPFRVSGVAGRKFSEERTWLRLQWTANGQLDGQDRVAVAVADAVAAAIERADVVDHGRRSREHARRRSTADHAASTLRVPVVSAVAIVVPRHFLLGRRRRGCKLGRRRRRCRNLRRLGGCPLVDGKHCLLGKRWRLLQLRL